MNSGAGLVLSSYMVRFSRNIKQRKKFIVAKLTVWVWCRVAIMNRQIVYVFTDAC